MKQAHAEKILSSLPGARQAADGVMIDVDGGGSLRLTNVWIPSDTEGLHEDEVHFLAFCAKFTA